MNRIICTVYLHLGPTLQVLQLAYVSTHDQPDQICKCIQMRSQVIKYIFQ